MRRLIPLAIGLLAVLFMSAPAQAKFALHDLDVTFTEEDGSAAIQAGSHPFAVNVGFGVDTIVDETIGMTIPSGDIEDLTTTFAPGIVADRAATSQCTNAEFRPAAAGEPLCKRDTVLGTVNVELGAPGGLFYDALAYNLVPPPGTLLRIGFAPLGVAVTIDVTLSQTPPYRGIARLSNAPQAQPIYSAELTLWGNPAADAHDAERGGPVDGAERPFFTLPRSCTGPLPTAFEVTSWQGELFEETVFSHGDAGEPLGMSGCSKLPFSPSISSKPTSLAAESASGLEFSLDFNDEGLVNPSGIAQSDLKKVAVTLPEGVTLNPSAAEGLEVCTPAQLGRETLSSAPGEGCPNASKVGTVAVDSPLVDERIEGSVYVAQQDDPSTATPGAENPFDTLVAIYIVLRNTDIGVLVKLPAKVEPDPRTGQLITTVQEAPQLPFSHFEFRFRSGARAPLITPPACGTYTTEAKLTPWADPSNPRTVISSFQIISGINGGPCPPGGVPPFKPGFTAGSLNNNAGSHSPFYMRLIRNDGEQDMTKFSSVLPPGVVGSLKGVGKCPDAAAEAAKAKTGRQEIASPSCPANSQVGRTLAGAGVGGTLVYVPGQVYLGGPYKGAPLSVIAITPAVAGPFDGGTVVVREGLDLNPTTAEVEVDGTASDPIPHILNGIPLKLRDLRVYVDRPNFILNPTSCDPSSARATLFGGYLDVFSPADDVAVDLASRYQAANCLNLPYKPRLALNLRGGAKRGDHPGLKAVFTPRPGDANTEAVRVTLPRSAFLEQAHIRTICTRVQFAAEQCPQGSIYGYAKAITPLLEEPVEGPVILRSSDHKLPDLVLALKGLVDVNVSSRIDSFKGGIRNTFEVVPDAPVTKFTLTLQGGKKGLIVNSRDLCEGKTSRAEVRLTAHNGRVANLRTKLQPQCGGKRKGK